VDFRHGSARFATHEEISKAGFLKPSPRALQLGYLGDHPVYQTGDSPLITFAGSGGGKLRDVIAHVICNYAAPTCLLDPKGELTAISLYQQHKLSVKQYVFNPYQQHNFITVKNKGDNTTFAESGQRWFIAFLIFDLEHNECASLKRIYIYITMVESSPERFLELAGLMRKSRFANVTAVAQEILTKQQAPKEFTAIMGTLHNAFAFMQEKAIADSLENPECNIEDIVQQGGEPAMKLSLVIPAEYLDINAPLLRLIFTTLMLIKQRHPTAPTVLHLIDEAAQLGQFDALLKFYTFARGGGNKVWSFWQGVSQIERNFGREAISMMIGSSQVRQFFALRDIETAKIVSEMIGAETFRYDDHLKQADARNARMKALRGIIEGGDPIFSAYEAQIQHFKATYAEHMRRPVRAPDELLRMPSDEQVCFIGENDACLYPILMNKKPYYQTASMAGKYFPNPYHPPADKVLVRERTGDRWARVLEVDPPKAIRDWPQFQRGCKTIEGYYQ
jgi:type IV secretion system protein VirD4